MTSNSSPDGYCMNVYHPGRANSTRNT